jgi:hypothetical protein
LFKKEQKMRHHCGKRHEKPLTPETFREDVISWAGTSIFLFAINWWTSPGFWWAFFPFFGWGIGIAMKAARLASRDRDYDWKNSDESPVEEKKAEKASWKPRDLV